MWLHARRVADEGRDSGGALIADEGRSHEQDALCAPAGHRLEHVRLGERA